MARLKKQLFVTQLYDPLEIPVKSHLDAIKVELDFSLVSVVELNLKKQVLTSEAFLQMVKILNCER